MANTFFALWQLLYQDPHLPIVSSLCPKNRCMSDSRFLPGLTGWDLEMFMSYRQD